MIDWKSYYRIADELERKVHYLSILAKIREDKGEHPGARQGYFQVLDLAWDIIEDQSAILTSLKGLARLLPSVKEWEPLREVYEKLIKISENPIEWNLRLGQLILDHFPGKDQAKIALEHLEEVIVQKPLDLECRKSLNRALNELEMWKRWLDSVSAEITLETNVDRQVDLLEKMAVVWESEFNNIDESTKTLRSALDLIPNRFNSRNHLVSLHMQSEDYSGAINTLLEGLNFHEINHDLQTLLAEVARIYWVHLNEVSKVKDNLKRSLMMNNRENPHITTFRLWSDLHYKEKVTRKEDPKLIEYYRDYLAAYGDQEDAETFYRYAVTLGDMPETIEDRFEALQRAIKKDVHHEGANRLLGIILLEKKEFQKAFEAWQRYLSGKIQMSEDLEVLEGQFQCAEKIGNWDILLEVASRLIELKSVETNYVLALIRSYFHFGNHPEKISLVIKNLETVLDSAELSESLGPLSCAISSFAFGQILQKEKISEKDQIPRWRMASDKAPLGSAIKTASLYQIGLLFEKLEQKHQAIKTFEEVLQCFEEKDSESQDSDNQKIKDLFSQIPEEFTPQWPQKLELHLKMGQMLEENNPKKAAEHYHKYFREHPQDRKLFEKLNEWFEKGEQFEELESLLDHAIQGELQADNVDEINISWCVQGLHRLAALRSKTLNDKEGAQKAFEQIIQLDFEDSEAHMALAALYDQKEDSRKEAIREHEWLLMEDPLRISSYRAILNHYQALKKKERAACLADILLLLGEAFPNEERLAHEVMGKEPSLRPGTISDEGRVRYLLDPLQNVYFQDLFQAMRKGLDKVYRFRMEKYSVNKSDRIDKNSPPAVAAIWQRSQDLYRSFGGKTLRIYWDRIGQGRFVLENDKVPALIISSDFFPTLSDLEQNFLIGRAIQYALDGFIVLQKIKPKDLEKTLQALLKKIDPDHTVMLSKTDLEEAEKTTSKLGRKAKNTIRPLLDLHVNPNTHVELKDWLKALKNTANRGGLLACGSLKVACDFITREEGYEVPENDKKAKRAFVKAIRKSKTLLDLFAYAASRNYFNLRELLFEED